MVGGGNSRMIIEVEVSNELIEWMYSFALMSHAAANKSKSKRREPMKWFDTRWENSNKKQRKKINKTDINIPKIGHFPKTINQRCD